LQICFADILHHLSRDEEAQALIAEYRNRIQQLTGALEEQQLTGSVVSMHFVHLD
jgi:ABC-type Fe3+-hydroxamate transport system substrate-binding protein